MITISDKNSIFLLLPAFNTSCCTDQIVDEVGEGPDHGHAGEGDAEQDDVQQADAQDVGQPHPSAVHHSCVGVHLAVCRTHVHGAQGRLQYPPRQPGQLWWKVRSEPLMECLLPAEHYKTFWPPVICSHDTMTM